MRTKGFATLLAFIISCVIIAALCTGAFYLVKNTREQNVGEVAPEALQNDLVKYIQRHNLGSTAFDFSTLEISKRLGSFLRATIFNSVSGKTQTIFAVKVNGEWKIAEVVESTYSCERMVEIGFKDSLIEDCTLSYPEAKKVSDVLAIYAKDRAPFQTSIIGTVLVPHNPSCNCLTISSGGEEIVIYTDPSSDEYSDFTEGDVIVVTGTVSTDNSGTPDDSTDDSSTSTPDTDEDNDSPNSPDDDDDVSVDADDIDEVSNDEDEALVPDEDPVDETPSNDPTDSPNPTDPDDSSGGGNTTDPIPEPDSTPGDQPDNNPNSGGSGGDNSNLSDINNENEIRLLND